MKTFLIAAVTAVALAGTGAVSAQTSVGTNANVNAGKTHVGAKASAKKHRSTTGAGVSTGIESRDNNASAKGSIIPGKDRLNSDAFIGAHGGN
jgi:hypothetical protein